MTDQVELKGRLNGRQRNRLKSLLNMLYTPRELSEEVGFTIHQVYRVYVPIGCPHTRDTRDHIWINGSEFSEWYSDYFAKRALDKDEAFCLTCKREVKMIDPERNTKNGLVYDLSNCSNCGRRISKIVESSK